MEQIILGGNIFKIHPYFYRYAASNYGCIIDIKGNRIKLKLGDDNYCYVDLDWWGVRYRVQNFV